MSQPSSTPPRSKRGPIVGFDERLWPINCLLFILSGIVIGLVLGTSRFDDPRIFYNAWFRLAIVVVGIGALFFAVLRLKERTVRRVQLCVLVSLLVHLGLGVYLHHKYLELRARQEKDLAAQMVDDYVFETVPEYNWERMETPDAEQAFEKPLDVQLPDGKQGQTVDRASLDHEVQPKTQPPPEPETEIRPADPLQPAKAVLSAPRRAEETGSRLSRQELLRELTPDTPIPQPEIERPAESRAESPTSDAARVARREPGSVPTQRRVPDDSRPRRASPRVAAMEARAMQRAAPGSNTPSPERTRRESSQDLQSRIEQTNAATREESLLLADSEMSGPARRHPRPSATQPLDRPAPTAGEEIRRPAAEARRAAASRRMASDPTVRGGEAQSLARSERGVELPSAAVEVPNETALAAARGSAPLSSLEVSSETAVVRSAKTAAPGTRTAATGSADFAVGSSRAAARIGSRRATGQEEPSIERAPADSGLARSRSGPTSLPDQASLLPAPSPAASAEAGAGGKQLAIAPGEVARPSRGGAASIPVRQAEVGAGSPADWGTPDRVPLAEGRRVTRFESTASGISGGGTPLPRKAPGRNMTMETSAEPADIASSAPTGGDGAGTPSASHLAGGPQRHVSGLPGARKTTEAAGSDLAMGDRGPSSSQAPARRDLASERDGRGTADSPSQSATLARADRGVQLPAAAEADDGASEQGAAGLAAEQGGLASSLEVGTQVSVEKGGSDAPPARRTLATGTADTGHGTDAVAVSLGRKNLNGYTGQTPTFDAAASGVGRSLTVTALPVAIDTAEAMPSESTADGSVTGRLELGEIARREAPRGNLPAVRTASGAAADVPAGERPAGVAPVNMEIASSVGRTAPSLAGGDPGASLSKTSRGGFLPSLAEETAEATGGMGDPNSATATSGQRLVLGPGREEPGRRRGGLPVRNSADIGPGGLSASDPRDVGLPSRHARDESLLVHTSPRRFLLERSGMRPALDATAVEPTEFFERRDPDTRGKWVEQFGGSPSAERAVELGLDYLTREQFEDGHWSLHQSPNDFGKEDVGFGQMSSDTAATGLALLSFFGAGYTHLGDKHRETVRAGVDWLVERQKDDGSLFTGGSEYVWLYSHGIAAIALCEAYGMTRDPALREPAERAIRFIVRAQHKTLGGWRYQPGHESDTSVSGWQLMAMKSAQMAGLEVPEEAMARTAKWLDIAQADGGTRYAYNPYAADTPQQRAGRSPNLAMTAEGLLMRMYLGWNRSDDRIRGGADHLLRNLPELGSGANSTRDAYYWYYATQVMFHVGGEHWAAWNERLRPLLEKSQQQEGALAGSWLPAGQNRDRWGHAGGRHYVTTMHLLMLEVYYRHLPLFQSGAASQ